MRYGLRLMAAMLIGVAWGCTNARDSSDSPLPLEPGFFDDLAWLDQNTLVVEFDGDTDLATPPSLWVVTLEPIGMEELAEPPLRRTCRAVDRSTPEALPDGRLGYVESCVNAVQDPIYARNFYVALDLANGHAEALAPLAPVPAVAEGEPEPVQDENPSSVAWDTRLRRAFFSTGGACSTIGQLDATGVLSATIDIVTDDGVLVLPDPVTAHRGTSCAEFPRSSLPARSPKDGIALFAAPDSRGVAGPARFDLPYNLYLYSPDGDPAVSIVTDIGNPTSLEWSHDGESIAFAGEYKGGRGVWLVNPRDNSVRQIHSGVASSVSWAPDDAALAATLPVGDGHGVSILPVPEATND